MVDSIDDYTDEDIEAVADFMSRLPIEVPQEEGTSEASEG